MAMRLIDPDGPVPVYHQVAIATGTTQVHLAGQVAWDEQGQLVAPGDLTGQVVQVYRNVAQELAAAGATLSDVDILFEEGVPIEAVVTAVLDREPLADPGGGG